MHTLCKLSLVLVASAGIVACGGSQAPTPAAAPPAAAPEVAPAAAPSAAPTAEPAVAPSAAPAATAAPSAPPGPTPEDLALCAKVTERELTCKDDFLPLLVDVRIKLDLPAGIAAKGKTKAGRDKLIAEAKKEIAVDHAPDKVKGLCEARMASTPPEAAAENKATVQKCDAEKDCKGFSTCMAAMVEKMLPKMQPPAAAAPAEPAKAPAAADTRKKH